MFLSLSLHKLSHQVRGKVGQTAQLEEGRKGGSVDECTSIFHLLSLALSAHLMRNDAPFAIHCHMLRPVIVGGEAAFRSISTETD